VSSFIDTGSAVTLIKESLANYFISKFNLRLHKSNKLLKSVNNDPVDITGQVSLTIKTKCKSFEHCFLVVKNVSCFKGGILLGRDFLKRCQSKINFEPNQEHIKLFGCSYSFIKTNEFAPQITCVSQHALETNPNVAIARTKENIIIPSSSGLFFKLSVSKVYENQLVVITQSHLNPSLILPRTLATVRNHEVPVTIFNLTDNEIKIPVNKIVAKIEFASDETLEPEHICDSDIKQSSNACKENASGQKGYHVNLISDEAAVDNTDLIPNSQRTNESEFNDLINDVDLSHLNINDRSKLLSVIYSHRDAIAVGDEVGRAKFTEHKIYVESIPPIFSPQYRVPYASRKIIEEHVTKLLSQGIIEPCSSPWSSPVLLVKKHSSNEYRFCVDFRKINGVIKKDLYPIPRIDDTLESLHGASVFTTLDMKNGFHQIPLAEESRDVTAFRTMSGSYRFARSPQGLSTSPAAFQRACNLAFSSQLGRYAYCYIDDVVIFSKTFDEHIEQLDEILDQIEKCGLKLGIKKCQFASSSVKYLGHFVDKNGIHVDPAKTKAISAAVPPKNQKQVRSFLGAAGYYRKFIKNFAGIAAPLSHLTRKKIRFKWTHECQEAFDIIKRKLSTAPVLAYPDNDLPYSLHTDASNNAIGAVLNQCNPINGNEQPIAYFSRKLKDCEINYSISEREALAIFEGVRFFQPYLWLQKFTIITDHTALKYIFKFKNTVPRIARWALYLSDYQYDIEYKSGKKHVVPDYLSRNDCEDEKIAVINTEDMSETLDTEVLIREQRSDEKLSEIIKHVEGVTVGIPKLNVNTSIDEFYIEDDVLFRLPRFNNKISKLSVQVVIPRSLINTALKIIHSSSIACHQGYLRTLQRARDNFYWPNMAKDVKNYVQCCLECQKRKWQGREVGTLGEFPPVSYPLERVGVDLIELPVSYSGNKYILTVIDHFSKYVSAYALPNKSAETVTRAMVTFISDNSVPTQIVSDRGSEFISELFTKTCNMLQAKNKFTTAYHPMANGLTEKANSTIKKTLSHLAKEDRFTWDEQIPTAVLAINTSFQTSIQEIPFFLFHGRDARLPFNDLINKQAPVNYAEEDYATEMSLRLRKAFSHVKNMCAIAHKRSAIQHNKKATAGKISVGDMVLLRNETGFGEGRNMLAWPTRYIGPYRVLQRNKNTFKIRGIYSQQYEQTVHLNRLKLANMKPDLPFPFNNNPQEDRSVDTEGSADPEIAARDTSSVAPNHDPITNYDTNPNYDLTLPQEEKPKWRYNLRKRI